MLLKPQLKNTHCKLPCLLEQNFTRPHILRDGHMTWANALKACLEELYFSQIVPLTVVALYLWKGSCKQVSGRQRSAL